jgi:hypothetical protein
VCRRFIVKTNWTEPVALNRLTKRVNGSMADADDAALIERAGIVIAGRE